MNDPVPTIDESLLKEVCRSVTALLAGAPAPPRRLCLRAGDVVVELEWPGAATGEHVVTVSAVEETGVRVPATASPVATEADSGLFYVRASTVGTFYRAAAPGAPPFVAEGDTVHPGQQLGILEAMKMMLPVEAPRGGKVAGFLVENAAAVEFDTPLIALTA